MPILVLLLILFIGLDIPRVIVVASVHIISFKSFVFAELSRFLVHQALVSVDSS